MPDFLLEPDDIESQSSPYRATRVVATGLAPTAEAPKAKRGAGTTRCAHPCETCGEPVLVGQTGSGARVVVDLPGPRCFTVLYDSGAQEPLFALSRAYAEHACRVLRQE